MGIINQGVYGGVSGKLGNLIGASWKGINYLRIKPASVANPNTVPQQDQRSKFSLTLKFLQPLNEFLKVGFKDYAVKKSAFNAAFSYNIQNSITGAFPVYVIDYQNALLSRGTLKNITNPAVVSIDPGKVVFTWSDNSADGNAQATDKAMLVVYNAGKKEAVIIKEGLTRDAMTAVVDVPGGFSGDEVQAWIAFVSADGQMVSNSEHAGSVVVAA